MEVCLTTHSEIQELQQAGVKEVSTNISIEMDSFSSEMDSFSSEMDIAKIITSPLVIPSKCLYGGMSETLIIYPAEKDIEPTQTNIVIQPAEKDILSELREKLSGSSLYDFTEDKATDSLIAEIQELQLQEKVSAYAEKSGKTNILNRLKHLVEGRDQV